MHNVNNTTTATNVNTVNTADAVKASIAKMVATHPTSNTLRQELHAADVTLVGCVRVSDLMRMQEGLAAHAAFEKSATFADLPYDLMSRAVASAWNDGRLALTSVLFSLVDLEIKNLKASSSGNIHDASDEDAGVYTPEERTQYESALARLHTIGEGREALFRVAEELASMTEADGGRTRRPNTFGSFDRAAQKRKPFEWLFSMSKSGIDEDGNWSEWTEAGPVKQSFDAVLRSSISGMAARIEADTRKEYEGRPVSAEFVEAKVAEAVERFTLRRQEAVEAVIIAYHAYADEIYEASDTMTYEDALGYIEKHLDWRESVSRIADKQYRIWNGEIADRRVTDFTYVALPWSGLYKDWVAGMARAHADEIESYQLSLEELEAVKETELEAKRRRAAERRAQGDAAKAARAEQAAPAPVVEAPVVAATKAAVRSGYAAFVNVYKQGQRPVGIR